jgi:hypothetical protein
MAEKLIYKCSSDYLKYREGILELPEREYGRVSPSRYDSQYTGNPYGEPLLGLCFDGERLVGQENYIRQDVACGGHIYKAALGVNTLVDSRYRLFHGVFGKLCKLTIEEMKKRVYLLCAFANEESKKYYLKYFEWKIASKVGVYKKITKYSGVNRESLLSLLRPGRPHTDLILERVSEFKPEILDPMIDLYVKDSRRFYFYKTSEYLNWRFLKNRHYDVTGYYILYNDKVCGFCATYDDGIEKKIVDILIENDDIKLFEKTISCLSHLSRKHGKTRLVIYATPGCWYEKALKRHFFIRRWDFDFITKSFADTLPDADWVIHIGDFDIF